VGKEDDLPLYLREMIDKLGVLVVISNRLLCSSLEKEVTYVKVTLPNGIYVVGTVGAGYTGLMMDTPNAAELVVAIANSEDLNATPEEKELIKKTAQKIASRYSGH